MPYQDVRRGRGGIPPLLLLSLPLLLVSPQEALPEKAPVVVQGAEVKNNCPSCHGWRTPNPTQRPIGTPHTDVALRHGTATLWCLTCHVAEQPAQLHTMTGQAVSFAKGYVSCTLCHGRTVTSWQEGIHGKQVAHWRGTRKIQSCQQCHAAHLPAMTPLVPAPPPRRPRPYSGGNTPGS